MPLQPPDWRDAGDGSAWVIGTKLVGADADRLSHVRYLTLWDSAVPPGFLSRLPDLELLELRGARSAAAVGQVGGHPGLRGLAVGRSPTLADLGGVGPVERLEFLDLYGLSQVEALPPLGALRRLRRLNLGQLIRLRDWTGLTSAPALESLWLTNRLVPDLDVLTALAGSPQFEAFLWDAPGENPVRVAAATRAAARPPASRVRLRDLWDG